MAKSAGTDARKPPSRRTRKKASEAPYRDPAQEGARRVRYVVAASLDAYIAGPNGEADWIISDPEIDFGELFGQFDTILMGRRTFESLPARSRRAKPQMTTVVFSRTLDPADYPHVTVARECSPSLIEEITDGPGKDVWLFGGGGLFASLLGAGLVDSLEVAVIPVLLGGGIPLLPPPAPRARLRLTSHRVYPTTGIVSLTYALKG